MFRANRIGTPLIHTSDTVSDTSAFTIGERLIASAAIYANVINASPVQDFAKSHLIWVGSARTISSGYKWGIGQQVTVTEPQVGDTSGLEINGAFRGPIPASTLVVPFFAKLDGAGGAVLEVRQTSGPMTQFQPKPIYAGTDDAIQNIGHAYRENVLIRNTTAIAGTYIHGFMFYNNVGASFTIDNFDMSCSVRQLNDQENVAYRDTRR